MAKIIEPTTEPVVETKADAFRRLAGQRVAKALERIELIANCANKAQYEYTPEQVEKIRQALITKVEFTVNRFAPTAKATSSTFEL